jgi:hypothetical protein
MRVTCPTQLILFCLITLKKFVKRTFDEDPNYAVEPMHYSDGIKCLSIFDKLCY